MSDKKVEIKIVDCTKSCKMTTEMRNSKFCNGKAKIVDGKAFYGCKENIKNEPKAVKQLYACDLWNMDLKDSCLTCPLECINNKNENFAKSLEERKQLENIIEDLKPNMLLCGVTADQVQKISSTYTKRNSSGKTDPMGAEAIKAANFANEALKMMLSGKRIDLAYFTLYARSTSSRINKLKKKIQKKN
ncbi:hypothetical protein CMI47_21020 [Candidatus Pacearchaeota archaeon]|jgi:hypothetical protein|nr:hypothetical protein [Candidatus Pacearchaeota archaeon]|tara:strand:- start:2427 stop:2993 length:567 start_codon:yes stop_codon:yes gene_type:complete